MTKKALVPLGALALLLSKFKTLLFGLLKFFPLILKTGGTMLLSVWFYAQAYGAWFAVGFVLLLLVHECGHLLAAKKVGLRVSAPIFIPFVGAFIGLKEMPRNAWIEAQVGIGGPLLGTAGAMVCGLIFMLTSHPLFLGLAYAGFMLNLFNLAPIGFLDGGRIVTALSPWLWVLGAGVMGVLLITQFNVLLLVIFVMSLPRLFSLFRRRSAAERRYFEVTPRQRWMMGALYFGLAAFLVLAMDFAEPHALQEVVE